MPLRLLLISCSLNPASRSRRLLDAAAQRLRDGSVEVDWCDLCDHPLPLCDGFGSSKREEVHAIRARVEAADAALWAVPIYNYNVNAAAKNFLELTSRSWSDKVVGFLCAAGGRSSYMSVMSFANSMMLDFRCLIVPRFVYASKQAFTEAGIDEEVLGRVGELCDATTNLARRLRKEDAD